MKDTQNYNLLKQHIYNALKNKNSHGKIYLGKISEQNANKILFLLNINVKNRMHVLSDNDVRHILKEHGNPLVELQKGQIAVIEKDIMNIPEIINNPDNIIKGNINREGYTIRYIKRYNNNISYIVEVIPKKSKVLKIKTMWKKPSTVVNSSAPNTTSKTKGSDISFTSTII